MKKSTVFLVLTAFLISVNLSAQQDSIPAYYLIDSLYNSMDYESSLQLCMSEYDADTTEAEILWRISRAYAGSAYFLDEIKDKQFVYEKAVIWGKKAVRADSSNSQAHLRYAIGLACHSQSLGIKEKVRFAQQIIDELHTSVKFDSTNHLAYFGIGLWHREIASLGRLKRMFVKMVYGGSLPASKETALKYLAHSVEIRPDFTEGWLELGKLCLDLKLWSEAHKALTACIELPPNKRLDIDFAEEARDLLDRYDHIMKKTILLGNRQR